MKRGARLPKDTPARYKLFVEDNVAAEAVKHGLRPTAPGKRAAILVLLGIIAIVALCVGVPLLQK